MSLKSFQEDYAKTVESVSSGVTKLKPFECTPSEREQLIQQLNCMIELLKIGERVAGVLDEVEVKGPTTSNGAKGVRKASTLPANVTTTAEPDENIRI